MVEIYPASINDVPSIVALLEDLDRFYGVEYFPSKTVRQRQVESLLFGAVPAAQVILARDAAVAIGLATYSFLWPAEGITASLYMKELYVLEGYRRTGIGAQLVRRVCKIAHDSGCSRVEWTTDRDNRDAQTFYDHLGVKISDSKLMYRLDGPRLTVLATDRDDVGDGN